MAKIGSYAHYMENQKQYDCFGRYCPWAGRDTGWNEPTVEKERGTENGTPERKSSKEDKDGQNQK